MVDQNNIQTLDVLLVDDHKMIRDGLKVMLSTLKKSFKFNIDEADTGEQALKKVSRKGYDLIIMDYHMPGINGAETVTRILRFRTDAKILALSNFDELPYIQSMVDAGVKGYILKNVDPSQMLTAIKTILDNKPYFSNEVALKLIEGTKTQLAINYSDGLTKREIEILKMIAMELTNDEISKKLSIGKRTVDSHRQNLLNKLHAKNTVGLIKAAYKLKLIT